MSRPPLAKHWCLTLNNYTQAEYDAVVSAVESLNYLVVGKEVGEGGTPHLQGYLILKVQKRINQVKVILGTPRVHLEVARSTPIQASDYCKKDGDFFEFGCLPVRKRNRDELASDFNSRVCAGGARAVSEFAGENPGVFGFSGHNLVRNFQQAFLVPKMRAECVVYWIWGATGVGKSHSAWAAMPNAYAKEGKHKWWHGYLGEKEVIIDDFGPDSIDIVYLLKWFDKYPCSVETKGGVVGLFAEKFIVTSNFTPEQIYPGHAQMPALLRRLKVIEKVDRSQTLII